MAAGPRRAAPRKAATPQTPVTTTATATKRPPVHAVPSAPAGNYAKLLGDVHTPGPYVITNDLVISEPNKARSAQIAACGTGYQLAKGQLQAMLQPILHGPEDPVLDAMGNPVIDYVLDDQGNPMLDENGKPYGPLKYHVQGTPVLDETGTPILPPIDEQMMQRVQRLTEDAAQQYDRALFGDAYDGVMQFFADEPVGHWNAFYKDVQDHFLPMPDTGKCSTCGSVIDEELAGKAQESSTS